MSFKFISRVTQSEQSDAPAYWFIFSGFKVLVHYADGQATLPLMADVAELGDTAVADNLGQPHYMGHIAGEQPVHCFAAELKTEVPAPEGMVFQGLRWLYGRINEDYLWLAGRAVQIIDWDRTHQFCSRCGTPTHIMPHERAKKCPTCEFITYPRLAPAVIVRVDRITDNGQRQILLARNHRFPAGFFSVLAGFVEPGETLEQCVRREIKEEVGIDVKNICYFGSQPWPFPHSLMIAYTAEYAGGEFVLEPEEIDEADWFAADNLPQIPPPMSISRRLIDDFIQKSTKA